MGHILLVFGSERRRKAAAKFSPIPLFPCAVFEKGGRNVSNSKNEMNYPLAPLEQPQTCLVTYFSWLWCHCDLQRLKLHNNYNDSLVLMKLLLFKSFAVGFTRNCTKRAVSLFLLGFRCKFLASQCSYSTFDFLLAAFYSLFEIKIYLKGKPTSCSLGTKTGKCIIWGNSLLDRLVFLLLSILHRV